MARGVLLRQYSEKVSSPKEQSSLLSNVEMDDDEDTERSSFFRYDDFAALPEVTEVDGIDGVFLAVFLELLLSYDVDPG
jgi:hypothetical protein